MFSDHTLNWRSIIWVFVSLATIIWFIIFAILNVESEILFHSLLRVALVFTIIYFAWQYFIKSAWQISLFNKFLTNTKPIIAGRWVGVYISNHDKKERNVTLEINQTLFTLTCRLWGEDNLSEVYSANILSTNDFSSFKLIMAYRAKRDLQLSKPGDQHEGLAVLNIINDVVKKMNGYYMTDRDPIPTKGLLNLVFESTTLKGQR